MLTALAKFKSTNFIARFSTNITVKRNIFVVYERLKKNSEDLKSAFSEEKKMLS